MTRAVKQIPPPRRVQVKEDPRNNNHLLLETRLEKVQPVRDRAGQPLEVQPDVERGIRHVADSESHPAEALDDIVTLLLEVLLKSLHLLLDERRLEHGDGGLLEGDVGAAVEVGTAGADGFDEFLWAEDPSNTPAWEAEPLGQAVDNEHVVFVDVDYVLGGGDGGSVAVGGVVVPRVELVADEGGALTADVLDFGELGVGDDEAGWVAGVGGDDDGGAAGDLLGDLVGVDVVAVFLGQGDGNGGEVLEEGEHFVVGGVVGDEEADVGVVQNGGNPNETSTAAGDDGDVLPGVLAGFALAVHRVVEVGYGFTERLDSGSWAVFTAAKADVNGLGPGEAAFNVIFHFRGTLCWVC